MGKNSGNGKMATNGRGRPSVLTPEVRETICEALRTGSYLETAAAYAGISKQTLYNWMRRGNAEEGEFAEFLDALKKALADGELFHLNNIHKASEKNWQASAWMLERKFPHKYGLRNREAIPADEIPEESGPTFDPSLLTIPELKRLSELGEEAQALHDKGLPADTIEAEFKVIADKGTPKNGKESP